MPNNRTRIVPAKAANSVGEGLGISPELEFGFLAPHKIKITKIVRVVVEGREYNKISLSNNSTELLSDEELNGRLIK